MTTDINTSTDTHSGGKIVGVAKIATLLGFLTLVFATYYIRSEVLALSDLKFSADQVRAEYERKQYRESFPQREAEYKAAVKQYELRKEHYEEMLELYRTDYDGYVQRIEDKYRPPNVPTAPNPPRPPEITEQLSQINAAFRSRKATYFEASRTLNWVSCAAALSLVGGLVTLMLLETGPTRWHYLVALVICFVFLIGPAFHSILSGIIGNMTEPRM